MFAMGDKEWPGLSKLVEEAGEVSQVCGKLIATRGKEEYWDGSNLRERLIEELGDLQAAMLFITKHADLDAAAIGERTKKKLQLFEEWHRTKQ